MRCRVGDRNAEADEFVAKVGDYRSLLRIVNLAFRKKSCGFRCRVGDRDTEADEFVAEGADYRLLLVY